MQLILLVLHVLICVSLIALILVQQGKGADIGAAFGSGASQTVFGSQGSTSFLFRMTATLAALFFMTSMALTYVTSKQAQQTQIQLPSTTKTAPIPVPTQPLSAPSSTNSTAPSNSVDQVPIPAVPGTNTN